jgi:hypothetical protein
VSKVKARLHGKVLDQILRAAHDRQIKIVNLNSQKDSARQPQGLAAPPLQEGIHKGEQHGSHIENSHCTSRHHSHFRKQRAAGDTAREHQCPRPLVSHQGGPQQPERVARPISSQTETAVLHPVEHL